MSLQKKRIVIVGATSAMAEHCARLWVHDEAVDLTLVGRSPDRLERVAADLRVRSPASHVQTVVSDFVDFRQIHHTVQAITSTAPVDIVLIAQGSLPDQGACQEQLQMCSDALQINGLSPVLFAEAFAQSMARADRGTLALIGSVAGDRGRRSNYVYGAAKGLVTRYAQGLQHRFAATNVKVVLIKPGPTDTPMTAHLKVRGVRMASVEAVASGIVDAVARGKATTYLPRKWALIMLIVRHLPAFVFNKINL